MTELPRLPTQSENRERLIADAYRFAGEVGLAMLDADEGANNVVEWHRQLFLLLRLFVPDVFSDEHRH
jgi:hypothetical protein